MRATTPKDIHQNQLCSFGPVTKIIPLLVFRCLSLNSSHWLTYQTASCFLSAAFEEIAEWISTWVNLNRKHLCSKRSKYLMRFLKTTITAFYRKGALPLRPEKRLFII